MAVIQLWLSDEYSHFASAPAGVQGVLLMAMFGLHDFPLALDALITSLFEPLFRVALPVTWPLEREASVRFLAALATLDIVNVYYQSLLTNTVQLVRRVDAAVLYLRATISTECGRFCGTFNHRSLHGRVRQLTRYRCCRATERLTSWRCSGRR
jgi:hypothetical protein